MGTKQKLQKEISAFTTNEELIAWCNKMKLKTFQDVFDMGESAIRRSAEFDMLWFSELLILLHDEDLLGEFDQAG
jgi:hypothetical protein